MRSSLELPFDEVAGLPLHPLIVHAAVVLVPLAALGLIVMATSGARSKRYSPAVVFVAVVGALASWLARLTGEELREQLGAGRPSEHYEYGELMPLVATVLLVVVIILALMDRQGGGRRNAVGTVVSLIAIVVALAAIAATVVTGHSGAELVWG